MSKHRPILNLFDFSRPSPASASFPSTVNIHEHRAPSVESAKLLREMQAEAMESIVGRISTPADTAIASEWIVERNPIEDSLTFHCVYSVNGRRDTFTVTKQRRQFVGRNINETLNEVMKDFIAHLGRQFVEPLMRAVVHNFRPEIEVMIREKADQFTKENRL